MWSEGLCWFFQHENESGHGDEYDTYFLRLITLFILNFDYIYI